LAEAFVVKVKIILADDHNIVREGLRSLIEKELGMEVVGEADNGRTTVRLAMELKPDMIIMDVSMPDLNGIEATRQITREFPDMKVLALSMHSDKRFVAGILKAGASGYLLKDCAFEEMAGAIRAVADGGTYLSPGVAGAVIQDYVRRLSDSDTPMVTSTLTPREREVLQLLAEGNSTKEVATRLNVSIKTVETHRRQLMDKLDIHSIAALTKYAIREGLTALE
jgi:two-component system response regulator NreC